MVECFNLRGAGGAGGAPGTGGAGGAFGAPAKQITIS